MQALSVPKVCWLISDIIGMGADPIPLENLKLLIL